MTPDDERMSVTVIVGFRQTLDSYPDWWLDPAVAHEAAALAQMIAGRLGVESIAAHSLDAHIRQVIERAGELTPEDIEKLRRLLRPVPEARPPEPS